MKPVLMSRPPLSSSVSYKVRDEICTALEMAHWQVNYQWLTKLNVESQ